MEKALSELIRISNAVGKDRALVQGVGGNTSVKTADGRYTYIKASGTALEDMSASQGWRRIQTESVGAIFQDASLGKMPVDSREAAMVSRLLSACDDDVAGGARPSVESPLHVILDRCVIHLHAMAALAYVSAKGGRARIAELFADRQHPPLWVPYADPGFSLGHKAFRLVRRYRKQHGRNPSIMFLEKHGLLVASDSADGALKLVHEVIARCNDGLAPLEGAANPRPSKQDIDRMSRTLAEAMSEIGASSAAVSYFTDPVVFAALAREDVARLLMSPALTPDEMGFVGGPIVYLASRNRQAVTEKIGNAIGKRGEAPVAFLSKGLGLFIVATDKMAAVIRDIVVGSLFIRIQASNMGGINALNKRQRDFIRNWESEKFRVQLVADQDD